MTQAWHPSEPRLTQSWETHRSDPALALTSLPSSLLVPLYFRLSLGNTSALLTVLLCRTRLLTTSLLLLCLSTHFTASPPTLPHLSLLRSTGLKPFLPTPIHLYLPTLPKHLTCYLVIPPFRQPFPLLQAVYDNDRLKTQVICQLSLWLVVQLTLFKR